MAFVAIYTVGRLLYPYEHPVSRDFFEKGYRIMRQASVSGHLVKEISFDGVSFPEEAKGKGYPVLTLTVWKNLSSLYRFTYSGKHIQALRNRRRWMESYQEKHISYVVWWTERIEDVSWEEAFKRYNYYFHHGPTPVAFDFKYAFDDEGETISLK